MTQKENWFLETIPLSSLQRLVSRLKNLIKREINIIDTNGIVIASTNPARLNTVHDGALIIIQNHLDQLIIDETNISKYPGSRYGINLPVEINGVLVCLVGISGKREDVELYGQIVQAFCVEQLKEIKRTQERLRSSEQRTAALATWMLFDKPLDEREFAYQLRTFNIDISVPKTVFLIKIHSSDIPEERDSYNGIHTYIESYLTFQNRENIVANFDYYRNTEFWTMCLIQETDATKLRHMAQELYNHTKNNWGVALAIGISSPAAGIIPLRLCYTEAENACRAASNFGRSPIKFFSYSDPELLTYLLPQQYRESFFQSIFKDMGTEELESNMQLVKSYIHNNGSIKAIAEELFIHKNTVQYRLNRLAERTNYDARNMEDLIWLYILLCIYQTM